MLTTLFDLARPMLFALDPEDAHELTLRSLEFGVYPRPARPDPEILAVKLWGLDFPNPIGIAAGFDKDARVPDAVLGLGCGFAELVLALVLAHLLGQVFRLGSQPALRLAQLIDCCRQAFEFGAARGDLIQLARQGGVGGERAGRLFKDR